MLVHEYFTSSEYSELGAFEVKALIDLYTQYRGNNNGDFCAAWSVMAPRGWRSKDALRLALKGLLDKGWITITRMGGNRVARLYGVTWLGVDHCDGKLDIKPDPVPMMSWRRPKTISADRQPVLSAPAGGPKACPKDELCTVSRSITGGKGPTYAPAAGPLYRSMPSGEELPMSATTAQRMTIYSLMNDNELLLALGDLQARIEQLRYARGPMSPRLLEAYRDDLARAEAEFEKRRT